MTVFQRGVWRSVMSGQRKPVKSGAHSKGRNFGYVILYGYFYSASHRRLFSVALSMTSMYKEKFSNCEGTQVISHVPSHSRVQEKFHSRAHDPLQQMPGIGCHPTKFLVKINSFRKPSLDFCCNLGRVYSVGIGDCGQLGIGPLPPDSEKIIKTFGAIPKLQNVECVSIAAGTNSVSFAVTRNGE